MVTDAFSEALAAQMPEGSVVLDIICVAKIVDADGDPCIIQLCSDDLTVWEAVGMATGLLDCLRQRLSESFEDDE